MAKSRTEATRRRRHRKSRQKGGDTPPSPLHSAVNEGNYDEVKRLVEEGADKDQVEDHWTPLVAAVTKGHAAIVYYLVEQGANKDIPDEDGRTPVFLAVLHRRFEITKYLVEQGADIDRGMTQDYVGFNPLMVAAGRGDLEYVQLMVEHGADKEKTNWKGWTPLYYAAYNDSIPVVKYLIEQGADVDRVDNTGKSLEDVAYKHAKAYLAERNNMDTSSPEEKLEKLYDLYTADDGPATRSEIPEKCNHEVQCPITFLSLKFLRWKKRLVKLDGRCYSFYAFAHDNPMNVNPFTRRAWSVKAMQRIKSIGRYRPTLQQEFAEIEEPEPVASRRRTRKGRTARQRSATRRTARQRSATRRSR